MSTRSNVVYSGKQHREILLSLDDELVKEKLRKLSSASSNGVLSPSVDPRSPMPIQARSRSYNSLASSVRSSQNENHFKQSNLSPGPRRDLAVDVSLTLFCGFFLCVQCTSTYIPKTISKILF